MANSADGTVSVIDGATSAVTATIRVGLVPDAVAVNPRTGAVYVANFGGNSVSVIIRRGAGRTSVFGVARLNATGSLDTACPECIRPCVGWRCAGLPRGMPGG